MSSIAADNDVYYIVSSIAADNDVYYIVSSIAADMEDEWRARHGVTKLDFSVLEVAVLRGVPHKAGHQWKFAGAFYYATNVLTTIGEYTNSEVLKLWINTL